MTSKIKQKRMLEKPEHWASIALADTRRSSGALLLKLDAVREDKRWGPLGIVWKNVSFQRSAAISSRCTVAVEGNCVLRESFRTFICYLFKEWLKCWIWHILDLVNISTACLTWWYSLSRSLVNHLMPETVNTPWGPAYLTLYSASLWTKKCPGVMFLLTVS